MVVKITGFFDQLAFTNQNFAIPQERAHTSRRVVVKTISEVVFYERTSFVATKGPFEGKNWTKCIGEKNPKILQPFRLIGLD